MRRTVPPCRQDDLLIPPQKDATTNEKPWPEDRGNLFTWSGEHASGIALVTPVGLTDSRLEKRRNDSEIPARQKLGDETAVRLDRKLDKNSKMRLRRRTVNRVIGLVIGIGFQDDRAMHEIRVMK